MMRRWLAGLAVVIGVASPVHAQDNGDANCTPFLDLVFNAAVPVLKSIQPGRARVAFLKDGALDGACPSAAASCASRSFVVAGDAVVVTRERGEFACATFTGGAPKFTETSGWLPRAALRDAAPATADWRGRWKSGPEQSIDFKPAASGRIKIEGSATWGASDPERVKRGGVNVGEISVEVTPDGAFVAFTLDADGPAKPYDFDKDDQYACRVKLWRLGPYLVTADNKNCGGHNVTFTGVYRKR